MQEAISPPSPSSIQTFLIQKLFTKDKHIILYPLQFFCILVFGVAPKPLCLKRCLLEQHIVVIAHKIKNVRVMKFSWSESIWYVLGENKSKNSINTTRYGLKRKQINSLRLVSDY